MLDRLTDVAGGHEPLALAAAGHWETPDEVGQPSERRRLALGILVPEIPDPKIWRDQLTNMLHDFHGVLVAHRDAALAGLGRVPTHLGRSPPLRPWSA
ncbi:MAG: hypothetical protein WBP81_36950 [Solirubrobacteraceae bacterium]